MHIDEILLKKTIDISTESNKLWKLFNEKNNYFSATSYTYSLFDVIDNCFRELPISGNCISYNEFICSNGFDASDIKALRKFA